MGSVCKYMNTLAFQHEAHIRSRAGNVITVEPGIYLPGKFGVRIEDDIVIRNGRCEVLTQSPKIIDRGELMKYSVQWNHLTISSIYSKVPCEKFSLLRTTSLRWD